MQNLQLVFFGIFYKTPNYVDHYNYRGIIDHRHVTLGSLHSSNSSMINWTKIFHKFWFSQGLFKYGCRWWGITVQRNKKALGAVVNILILTISRGAGFENTRANEKINRTCKTFLRLRRDGKESSVFFLKKCKELKFSKDTSTHHDAVRSRTSPGCNHAHVR